MIVHQIDEGLSRSKISKFNVAILIDEDWGRFKVAYDDPFWVSKCHRIHNFKGKSFDNMFGEGLILFDKFEKVSSRAVLSDSPHMVLSFHVFVKFDDVRVH